MFGLKGLQEVLKMTDKKWSDLKTRPKKKPTYYQYEIDRVLTKRVGNPTSFRSWDENEQ